MVPRTLLSILSLTAIAALSSSFTQDPVAAPARQPGALVSFFGANCAVEATRYVKVTTKESWAALWLEHAGKRAHPRGYDWYYNPDGVPVVDFDQCMVIGVFQGKCINSTGIRIVELLAAEDRTVLRFVPKWFQTGGPDGGAVQAQPFGFFVIPRDAKPIELQEDVQDMLGKPPKWKTRAKL